VVQPRRRQGSWCSCIHSQGSQAHAAAAATTHTQKDCLSHNLPEVASGGVSQNLKCRSHSNLCSIAHGTTASPPLTTSRQRNVKAPSGVTSHTHVRPSQSEHSSCSSSNGQQSTARHASCAALLRCWCWSGCGAVGGQRGCTLAGGRVALLHQVAAASGGGLGSYKGNQQWQQWWKQQRQRQGVSDGAARHSCIGIKRHSRCLSAICEADSASQGAAGKACRRGRALTQLLVVLHNIGTLAFDNAQQAMQGQAAGWYTSFAHSPSSQQLTLSRFSCAEGMLTDGCLSSSGGCVAACGQGLQLQYRQQVTTAVGTTGDSPLHAATESQMPSLRSRVGQCCT
jgi:hypothetical protein